MEYVMIALGGALGSIARYGCARFSGQWGAALPYGTLLVNLLGSFLLGILFELCANRMSFGVPWRLPLGVGLMGGFTTFSSFSVETIMLIQRGAGARAVAYVLLSVGLGLLASAMGLSLGRTLQRGL